MALIVEYRRFTMDEQQFAVSQQSFAQDSTWDNSKDIHIDNFSISVRNKTLFDNASLHINSGGKYGLIGPNGQGKTTILKMIALGELKIPPNIDFLYVEQEVIADDTRAIDVILKTDHTRWSLLEEEKRILEQLKIKQDDALDDRLNEVYEQLSSINASATEARARRILHGLGFDTHMQEKATKDFSGGWRMRISLAKALFIQPTLLMLDEPTNHLDLNAVIWLNDYLQKWKNTLLVISHDAELLNNVCTELLHVDQCKLVHYKGNYDFFCESRDIKQKQAMKAWEKQQKQIKALKAAGKSTKKTNDIIKNQSAQLLQRPKKYWVEFSFPETTQISSSILEIHNTSFRYNEESPYLFTDIDFGIYTNSRVCIVGPNGAGKSTLLKMITGEVQIEGDVWRNPQVRIGVYNQHFVDKLPMNKTPIEYLQYLFKDETYQSIRNLLGKVGLEGHAHTVQVQQLSGGQKARVVIAEMILMRPHILILDEPTNNLDIESINALCDTINNYDGGVIIVSHNAKLIESTECELWVVGEQKVMKYDGTFREYSQMILDELETY